MIEEYKDETGSSLKIFVLCLPLWDQRFSKDIYKVEVVVISTHSIESAAVEALPILDIPVYKEMANKFLHGEACGTVARALGGSLMDHHAAMTVFGEMLPGGRPDLVAMLGSGQSFAPPPPPPKVLTSGAVRRVLNRG